MRRLHNRRANCALLLCRANGYLLIIEFTPALWNKTMINRIATRLKNFRSYSKSIVELREMDDHMLADIGVMRGEIGRAVRFGRS